MWVTVVLGDPSSYLATPLPEIEASTSLAMHTGVKSLIKQNIQKTAFGQNTWSEVDRPRPVDALWNPYRCLLAHVSFPTATVAQGRSIFVAEPVKLLRVHIPTLALLQKMQSPVVEAYSLRGHFYHQLPQLGIIRPCRTIAVEPSINPDLFAGSMLPECPFLHWPGHSISPLLRC